MEKELLQGIAFLVVCLLVATTPFWLHIASRIWFERHLIKHPFPAMDIKDIPEDKIA